MDYWIFISCSFISGAPKVVKHIQAHTRHCIGALAPRNPPTVTDLNLYSRFSSTNMLINFNIKKWNQLIKFVQDLVKWFLIDVISQITIITWWLIGFVYKRNGNSHQNYWLQTEVALCNIFVINIIDWRTVSWWRKKLFANNSRGAETLNCCILRKEKSFAGIWKHLTMRGL